MLQRILALILKELTSLWSDKKTRYVLLIPPLIQVFIFANAANYDVTHVPLGIWNEDAGAQSAELVRRFTFSPALSLLPLWIIRRRAGHVGVQTSCGGATYSAEFFCRYIGGSRRTRAVAD